MREQELRVIKLTGSPLNRGRIHGEELRSEICRLNEAYQDSIEHLYGINVDEYLESFMEYQDFTKSIMREAPDLLEEVRGISEGSGLSFNRALLLQLVDEEWVFGRTVWPKKEAFSLRSKCTSFGVVDPQNGRLYSGQNMDVPPFHEGLQVVFHICQEGSDLESYIFSSAGLLGLMGLNNAPLGVCCNTLMELPSSNHGLPVLFIVRRLLECGSFKEARGFLKSIYHASGQNFLISSRQEIGSFECSEKNVIDVKDITHHNWICHTNHVLAANSQSERVHSNKIKNSRERLSSISGRISQCEGKPRLEVLKQALGASDNADHPVSRKMRQANPGDVISYTSGAAIYEMGEKPRLHIAPGPPCETDFRVLEF